MKIILIPFAWLLRTLYQVSVSYTHLTLPTASRV